MRDTEVAFFQVETGTEFANRVATETRQCLCAYPGYFVVNIHSWEVEGYRAFIVILEKKQPLELKEALADAICQCFQFTEHGEVYVATKDQTYVRTRSVEP